MEYPLIDIRAIAAYHNVQYLQYKQPLADYVNNAKQDAAFMDRAMDYTHKIYDRWLANRGNDDYQILNRDVVNVFIGKSGESMEDMGNEYRQAEFFLSYCLGIFCNANKDENIVAFILSLSIDNDWTGFAISFNPDRNVIKGLMGASRLDQKELLKVLINCRRTDEGFEEYYTSLSLDQKLNLIDSPYFDTEFFTLYEYLTLPVTMAVKYGDFGLLADFLLQYSLAPIQQQCLTGLKNPQSILSLFDAVSSKSVKNDNVIVLQHIVMHHWYESILSITKDYALPYNGTDPILKALWHDLAYEFKNYSGSMIQDALRVFVSAIGPKAVAKWIFTKQPLSPVRETTESKITNDILAECKEQAQAIIGFSGFNPEIRDLAYVSAFAEYFTDNDGNEEAYSLIRDSIFEALKTDRRFLSNSITDNLLQRVHILCEFLYKRFKEDLKGIFDNGLNRYAVRYEGILTTPESEMYAAADAESQFLLIFLYLTSFMDDKSLADHIFKKISVYTLHQCVFSPNRTPIDDNYQRVLDLCELIADQCLPEVKEEFESNCVNIFPDVAMLIFVFAKSRTSICPRAKEWLMNKGIHDWSILKRRLLSRSQQQYADNLQNALDAVLKSEERK